MEKTPNQLSPDMEIHIQALGKAYLREAKKYGEDIENLANESYTEVLDDIRSLLCHMSDEDGAKFVQLLLSLSAATEDELESHSSPDAENANDQEATPIWFKAPSGEVVTVDEAEEVFEALADLEDYSPDDVDQMERLAAEIVSRFTAKKMF